MDIRKIVVLVLAVVLGLVLVHQVSSVDAVCVPTSTFVIPYASSTAVVHWFNPSISCALIGGNATCNGQGPSVTYLSAIAQNSVVSPYCSWTCECGPYRIDGSDGLPVELMSFSVE